MDTNPTQRIPCLVIGAGQCGLATAHHLRQRGIECLIVDERARVGDQWRQRYDSLLLNSPAYRDGLPGRPFPAAKWSFPSGRDMADYLEAYAADLDVRLSTPVRKVERLPDGSFDVDCGATRFVADTVVVATGSERVPRVPELADRLDPAIRQLHSSDYRNPDQLLPGPVLVVGAGQSGTDVALELARAGRETWLSGRLEKEIPVDVGTFGYRRMFPVLWFAWNHVLTTGTPIGRRAQAKVRGGAAPLVRVKAKHLRAVGVHLAASRTIEVADGMPTLEDGTVLDVANVVWCTGFRQDFSFIHPPVTRPDGWPAEVGGVVPDAPGLFFMGLLFQRGFYSMLIGGAGRDAEHIAGEVARHLSGAQSRQNSLPSGSAMTMKP